jgi:arylsulfatase A-like enzyme
VRPPNLVIVTVDCMRRDRISAYGYERKTTPFLDRLLDRSLHATSAHSVSSWTCPAVISLITGLYPHRHGGGLVPGDMKNLSKQNLPTALPAAMPTLSDMLSAGGYATAAIGAVWNAHLSIPGRFDHMAMVERPAEKLVRRSIRWIAAQDRPFFLWLHVGDAHEPLDVPRSMRNLFGPVPRIPKVTRWDYTRSSAPVESAAFRRYRDARVRLYDVAVRSADAAVQGLWLGLQSRQQLDRTIVVVTSDHGEEFWEHREEEMASFIDPRDVYGTGHGHHLFQVHLLVPLVVSGPGIEAREFADNASLVDVAPTVLQAAGIDHGPVDGRSLLDPVAPRPVLAEAIAYGREKKAVVMGDRKLLSAPGDGYERAFVLGPQRREAGTIEDGGEIAELRGYLPAGPEAPGEPLVATREMVDHLRDLGYIE